MAEKDYISREAAINEQKRFCGYLDNDMLNRLEIAMSRIPAADVRPVVLCHDCGHCIDGFICENGHWNGMTFPSNFCSDGERKEGADGDKREES